MEFRHTALHYAPAPVLLDVRGGERRDDCNRDADFDDDDDDDDADARDDALATLRWSLSLSLPLSLSSLASSCGIVLRRFLGRLDVDDGDGDDDDAPSSSSPSSSSSSSSSLSSDDSKNSPCGGKRDAVGGKRARLEPTLTPLPRPPLLMVVFVVSDVE
jgi:hypothetical protein